MVTKEQMPKPVPAPEVRPKAAPTRKLVLEPLEDRNATNFGWGE
jgi:hypothetical protein